MGRICAMKGCGNSTYNIERWKQLVCVVHNCWHASGECDCPKPFQLYTFPTDTDRRAAWTALVNRKVETRSGVVKNWAPNQNSRVCSKHFVEGKPTEKHPNPTFNLGYQLRKEKTIRPAPKPRQPLPGPSKVKAEPASEHPVAGDHEAYHFLCQCTPGCSCEGCMEKHHRILQLEHQLACLKEPKPPTTKKENDTLCSKFLQNDRKTRMYTGLPNRKAFYALYNHLAPKARKMTYWVGSKRVSTKVKRQFPRTPQKSGPKRKLPHQDELLLVLMKLRLGVTSHLLADMCGISAGSCSHIFNTWIKMLAVELKPLIFWPDKAAIQATMPSSLGVLYPNLRCTLDCTEFFIERPRHLEIQALTWSDYKKHNTAKVLVAIAPNGMISFVSKAWGGRTSDRKITRESGFLNLVDPTDVILADRGFTIQEDLLLRQATLFIPPPSSGLEQQSRADVLKTKKIANARIHVERAIGRMKWFTILKNVIPITLVPLIDDIVIVCAALCNLLEPLVS